MKSFWKAAVFLWRKIWQKVFLIRLEDDLHDMDIPQFIVGSTTFE